MGNNAFGQGAQDARQGNGPANTHGMPHQQANSYNAGYQSGKNK